MVKEVRIQRRQPNLDRAYISILVNGILLDQLEGV